MEDPVNMPDERTSVLNGQEVDVDGFIRNSTIADQQDVSPEASTALENESIREIQPDINTDTEIPEPRFKLYQKVYARDKDGLTYEAIIRRSIYGINNNRQAQMGLLTEKEAIEMGESEEEPSWHYFIHYNKWNVNWDRWMSESDIFEPSEHIVSYAKRLHEEHRDLQKKMTKKLKGKKAWQTIDGTEFLRAWRRRLAKIDEEMGMKSMFGEHEVSENEKVDPDNVASLRRSSIWTKASLINERRLRDQGLTGQRQQSLSSKLPLPFSLKKVLVEQWEIISQCRMVPVLPASVSIRQALQKYVESKEVFHVDNIALDNIQFDQTDGDDPTNSDPPNESNIGESAPESVQADAKAKQCKDEWLVMEEGIATLFDQALPTRLIYQQELPQLKTMDSIPEFSVKRYSDIYGCEHLLRLFVRLPAMLTDRLTEADARPIYAKVNDFIRFLHKNQDTLLVPNCRPLNELETKELETMHRAELKRKGGTVDANLVSNKRQKRMNVVT